MNNICEILENVDLQNYNTYKIKTYTKYLAKPQNETELINLLKYLKENQIKYFILGNGSNVILPDETFDGVVISLKKLTNVKINGTKVYAEAGIMMPVLVKMTIDNNLQGLEWASGIPGTLGGSILGNAGAYLHDIMEYVESVDVLSTDLKILNIKKEDISYDYRTSIFKENKNYIILGAYLNLEKGNKEDSLNLVSDRLRRRIESQPLDMPSAGSVFRNPSKEMPAGKIIEELGFKGKRVGNAKVSEKHANFIVNDNNATSKDIINLINTIKKEVLEKYNIDLICEQEIIDWNK